MLASSLVVRGNLRIAEAYPVLAVTARAALDDGRDHLDDRQDFPASRVRLGSALDLSDPLVQRPCPEPAESCSSGHAGIADKAVTGKHFPSAARQRRLRRLRGSWPGGRSASWRRGRAEVSVLLSLAEGLSAGGLGLSSGQEQASS